MSECQGPCLLHCYQKNSIGLLLIGFIIGLLIGYLYMRTNNLSVKQSDINND